jgi:hypothetical protein
MKEETRRAIAHAASARINGEPRSSVYSYSAARHTHFSKGNNGGGYDYDAGAHVGGSRSGLYHYGLGSHISLKVNGKSFFGYDYGSGAHFSGKVNGHSVQMYDYGEGRHFHYTA